MLKSTNKKIQKMSMLFTLIIVLIILLVAALLSAVNKKEGEPGNVYNIDGDLLSSTDINKNYSLVTENDSNYIYGVTLNKNALVSKVELCNSSDVEGINDFNIVLNKEKEFSYVSKKGNNGFVYKIYKIDKEGKIGCIDEVGFEAIATRSSLPINLKNGKYEYIEPYFFYNGEKVIAEVGNHEISESPSKETVKPIKKESKIAISGKYNAIPRKVELLKDFPEYVENVNYYLKDINKKQCIETDLDGDGEREYIVSFVNKGITYTCLFDNSANFIANLMSFEGEFEIDEKVEIADVDNDGVMEIIQEKNNIVEVHKYNGGFYY